MAKRPLRSPADIERIPVDQPVDLDLTDDPVVTIEKDEETKPPPKKADPPIQAEPEVSEDAEKVALKKQLEDMRAAESNRAAEMARYAEIERQNQELRQQNNQHVTSELEAQYDSVLNAIAASESEASAASQAYEQAASLGDYKAQAEAQRKLSRAEASLVNLENGKAELESRREALKKNPPRQEAPPQQDPLEANIAGLPDLAKNWIRSHRDYMTDPNKYVDLQMAHLKSHKAGITAYSQPYIEFIETELGLRQKLDQQDDEPRRTPVSAPVSRDPPSPSTGVATSSRITLSAEQREYARFSMPDLPPGEAEKAYAQQLLKLNGLKKAGHYREG